MIREVCVINHPPDSEAEYRRQMAVHCIENDLFVHDPYQFYFSVRQNPHPLMLAQYSLAEFTNMKIFKVPMFNMGFALRDRGERCEIVGLHNSDLSIRNVGQILVHAAIRQGGNALDHFGSEKLNNLYESLGFVEVYKEPFDPQYDPEGLFRATYGELPVIYRVLDAH